MQVHFYLFQTVSDSINKLYNKKNPSVKIHLALWYMLLHKINNQLIILLKINEVETLINSSKWQNNRQLCVDSQFRLGNIWQSKIRDSFCNWRKSGCKSIVKIKDYWCFRCLKSYSIDTHTETNTPSKCNSIIRNNINPETIISSHGVCIWRLAIRTYC